MLREKGENMAFRIAIKRSSERGWGKITTEAAVICALGITHSTELEKTIILWPERLVLWTRKV